MNTDKEIMEEFDKEFKEKCCNCSLEFHEGGIDCPQFITIYKYTPDSLKSFLQKALKKVREEEDFQCNVDIEEIKRDKEKEVLEREMCLLQTYLDNLDLDESKGVPNINITKVYEYLNEKLQSLTKQNK